MKERAVLAVDIGGSKYIGGLVSLHGEIIYSRRCVWDKYDRDYVVESLYVAIQDVLDHCPDYDIEAIGMTIPGLADPKTGMWLRAGFMKIDDLPIAALIKQQFGYPVFIDNDGRACAAAERHFGSGRDCTDYLYMTVSNGVGGALVLNGELYFGSGLCAGEIGQCVVGPTRSMNGKTVSGTLENYCCADGIVQTFVEQGGKAFLNGQKASGESIAALARTGDTAANRTLELQGQYLGLAIAWVYNLLDIQKVIIGGGLSLCFDLFEPSLIRTLHNNSFVHSGASLKIEATPLKYEGALIGAATLAMLGRDLL